MITISTLKVDRKKFEISEKKVQAIKNFFWWIYANIWDIVKTNQLIVPKLEYTKYKPNDQELWYQYLYDKEIEVSIILQWFHREIFWLEKIKLKLPWINNGTPIKDAHIFTMIVLPLVRDWFWDDEYYKFLKPLLQIIPLVYNEKTWKIWYSVSDFKKKQVKFNKWSLELSKINVQSLTPNNLLDMEIEQWFINKEIWDPNRWYAFTHRIREMLDMKFFYWQNRVVELWNKINIVFAVRNTGKTAFACYIWLRELVSEKKWFWIRKSRKIIYFVPDKVDIWEQVMDYIVWYIDSMFDASYQEQLKTDSYKAQSQSEQENTRFKLKEQIKKLKRQYFSIDRSKYAITCHLTWHSLKIVSLQDVLWRSWKDLWTSKWEWLACDVYIIDEAPRIPDTFWNSFWERAETESEYWYISWTLNQETPKNHWAYKLWLEWELWNENISTHRVALWNNENLFTWLTTEKEKKEVIERERIKLLDAWWIRNLYCRWYGIILNENKVFNITWCIKWVKPATESFHHRIIIIDFWWDSDPIWFMVYNINMMYIEHSELIMWLDIHEQLKLVWNWKKKYKNVYTLWDGTWVGRLARASDIDSVIDYYITFSTWPQWKYNKEKWYYAVDKWYMVDLTRWYFDKMMITFLNTENDLMDHIRDFRKITNTWAKVQQYEAKRWSHDDLVACLLMLSVFLTEWIWLIKKEQFTNYWLDASDNLDYTFDFNNNEDDNLYHNWFY